MVDEHSLLLTFQKVRNILELWNVAVAVAAVLLQQREYVVEFAAGVCRVECRQLIVDGSPRINFLLRVFNTGNLFTAQELLLIRSIDK